MLFTQFMVPFPLQQHAEPSSNKVPPESHKRGCYDLSAAFTLIELITVVAIVAILAILAFTQVQKMIERSHEAACASNLRQISAGLMAYVADNDGSLPPAANIRDGEKTGQWYNLLEPYLGERDIPWDSANRPEWQQCPAKKFTEMSHLTVGYGWNFQSFGHDNWDGKEQENSGAFSRMVQVSRPARTIIIGDSLDDTAPANDFRNRYMYWPVDSASATTGNNLFLARRHGGRGNYLFLDGHIEALTPEYLIKDAKDFPQQSLFLKVK